MTACWRTRPKDRPMFIEIRQQLDKLLSGICSHTYLSLDVIDYKDLDDLRKKDKLPK